MFKKIIEFFLGKPATTTIAKNEVKRAAVEKVIAKKAAKKAPAKKAAKMPAKKATKKVK
jgi:hypothetical protein